MGCGCKKNQAESTEAQIANKQIAEEQLKSQIKKTVEKYYTGKKIKD
ncbi:MAG: hypothetical protein K9I82_02310 [Chitinophagaceae bacterium]|jgi:hypothetical protein|nr:hypothetical protein [Chitinophagaceae bacterium]